MNIQAPRKQPRVEITNAIDIMFFLLIFFMLFSTLDTERAGMEVKLPSAATGSATSTEDIVISIDDAKKIYWGDQGIPLEQLEALITRQLEKNENSRFIVQADRTVQYDDLVQVLDSARLAGGTKVALAVRPKDDAGEE